MQQPIPIPTVDLFPIVDDLLIELLHSLSPKEWHAPTLAKKWLVKDIVAHLLDGNIRTLSLSRDQHLLLPTTAIDSYPQLVDYLNELNATWVNAFKRSSPALLVELLELTGKQYSDYIATLKPFDDAIFSVAWAGETVSKNWFHIAREYTEKVHHQLQIREAVGKPGLLTKELFYPFIDTLMQALPHTYRNTIADKGVTVQVTISTAIGGDWFLTRSDGGWQLSKQPPSHIDASVSLEPDAAWKLFTKGLSPEDARQQSIITGKEELLLPALKMISVMG